VARSYCPGCEPDADPIGQILVVRWCEVHQPGREGADDAAVSLDTSGALTIEAGGTDNQRWCALLHRDQTTAARNTAARRRSSRPRRVAPAQAP
jgi:hypothetical protein